MKQSIGRYNFRMGLNFTFGIIIIDTKFSCEPGTNNDHRYRDYDSTHEMHNTCNEDYWRF